MKNNDLNNEVKPTEIQNYCSSRPPLVREKILRDEPKELLFCVGPLHAVSRSLVMSVMMVVVRN